MVQTHIIHPNVQVNEITREFRNAASKLASGKLVKDEHFTLFEGVSALEIGDPKMDSGCTAFDSDDGEEFNPPETASAEEVLWLMDELMYREIAWHMGYPLSQTIFTSIHVEKLLWPEPKQLSEASFWRKDATLRATPSLLRDVFQPFCIGLIKCCDLVLSMVTSQHYYEEEDFATQTFNRPLLHDFSVGEVMDLLQAARGWLNDCELPSALSSALEYRLDLRYTLLQLFHNCEMGDRTSLPPLENSVTLLKKIEDTLSLGRSTPTVAFTLKIQRRLASSVPPRPMIVIEKDKAFPFIRQLITDATTAFQLLDISSSSSLLTAYQHFVAQPSLPSVYARALLQSFLGLRGLILGHMEGKDFITRDIRGLVLPNELLFNTSQMNGLAEDQQIELEMRVHMFVDRCGGSFLNLFRTLCLNRCRVRRTMCHAALEWDQIQSEAEELDTFAQSVLHEEPRPYPQGEEPTFAYPFSSWVYHYKLVQLQTVLQMGFELSIYAPYELAGMYWYLSFLTGTHMNHLERISFFVAHEKQAGGQRREQSQSTLRQLYRHFSLLKATEAMAKALHRVFAVLQRHGQFSKPAVTYASDALRYELRMRPFLHLSIPEPISVDVARQSSALEGLSDVLLVEQANKLTQTARKAWEEVQKGGWHFDPLRQSDSVKGKTDKAVESVVEREWSQNVRNSMKACIGIGIATTVLSKALQGGEHASRTAMSNLKIDVPPVGDRDRWHSHWPVPKIRN